MKDQGLAGKCGRLLNIINVISHTCVHGSRACACVMCSVPANMAKLHGISRLYACARETCVRV